MMHEENVTEKSIMKNGMRKVLRVEKVENGYVISITKEGEEKGGEYKYECKKYISTSDPLENKVDESNDMLKQIEMMM